jgi:hypothetical protein
MTNLIESLGTDYFNQRFEGSMFRDPEGRPSFMEMASHNGVSVKSLTGVVGKLSTVSHLLPHAFFSGLEVFAVPDLGWRSVQGGRFLARLSRNNQSYARGVTFSNLRTYQHPMTTAMMEEGLLSSGYYAQRGVITKMVFDQEYLSLSEGLSLMREGDVLSFCISPNMAVVAEGDDVAGLLLGDNKVGTVSYDGTINCSVPFLKEAIGVQA